MRDLEKALGEEKSRSPSHEESHPSTPEPTTERFTRKEKWFIVSLVALAGLFSPLTSNIYFPAIPTIAKAFNKSTELINLTVTMYVIFQGLAPMLWGTLSDFIGRRPTSAACLALLSLSCVGLALVPTSDYWLLMLLRCFQAAGSASTIAIGAGVIGDISTSEERGGFFGIFTLGPMVGPALGPVIGGLLANNLGWRSIFWFLCISSSACLITLILFMPETLRSLSSSTRFIIYSPVIPIIGKKLDAATTAPSHSKPLSLSRNPLLLFTHLDILILLAINALICGVFYGVTASTSTLFESAYPFLNETTIGLCFLAMGGGMVIGSSVIGRVLDREFQVIKRQEAKATDAKEDMSEKKVGSQDPARHGNFPIEKARLRILPTFVLLMAACSAGYGWCLKARVNIAGPLILQVAIGFVSIAVMNSTSTLMIDLMPRQSSTITACNNLIRCTFSAVIVSVIQIIIDHIGTGWTYVLLSGLSAAAIPLLYLAMKIGPSSREKRRVKTFEATQAQNS